MKWRTAAYEFVDDRLAIDLLFGCADAREAIEAGADAATLDAMWRDWQKAAAAFAEARQPFLRYR